jgi:hypothetical protein
MKKNKVQPQKVVLAEIIQTNEVFTAKKISREKSIELEKGYKNGKRRFSRKQNIYSPKKVERNQLQD